jgi:hypothetical protein
MIKRLRKIIVVSGISNSGKTTTIKLAMQKLGIYVDTSLKGDILFAGYANSGGGYFSCGIATAGDTDKDVKHNIKYFENVELPIGIIIIACKSRGRSQKAAKEFVNKHELVPDTLTTISNADPSKYADLAEELSDKICKLVC